MSDIILNKEENTRTIVNDILEENKSEDEVQPPVPKKKTTRKIKKDKIILQK
jgi:hypothetical protein